MAGRLRPGLRLGSEQQQPAWGHAVSPAGSAEALHLTDSWSPPADHLEGSSPTRPCPIAMPLAL